MGTYLCQAVLMTAHGSRGTCVAVGRVRMTPGFILSVRPSPSCRCPFVSTRLRPLRVLAIPHDWLLSPG